MKRHEVCFRPEAAADLVDLYDYIAENGGRAVARSMDFERMLREGRSRPRSG